MVPIFAGCRNVLEPDESDDPVDAGDASADADSGTDTDDCEGEVVVFPDPVLDGCVRAALGQPEGVLRTEDVAEIEEINMCDPTMEIPEGVSSLEGAQCLVSVRYLSIYNSSVSDLSPFAGHMSLEVLVLEDNHVADLSPLAGVTSLTSLYLELNFIDDVSPLAGLTEMTYLVMFDNGVTDISALAGLTKMVYFDFSNNGITDISAIAGYTEIVWLLLEGNAITDLSPLVANAGIDEGDDVSVVDNPIDEVAQADNIAALCDRGVLLDPYCP